LNKRRSLAQRTISSISWNFIGNLAQIAIAFLRSILLARLLPVETFGIYAWAHSVVALTGVLPDFGLGGAFVHRAPETENEEHAAAVQFTFQIILTTIWTLGLFVWMYFLVEDVDRRTALLWTILTAAIGSQLTRTPRLILARRVVHRRLALVQLLNTLFSSVVAVVMAFNGATLSALLATDVITLLINIVGFYLWRPVWRPRITWDPSAMRYFFKFGSYNVIAITLLRALDRVDDIWVGAFLGDRAMGLYSRAYQLATYPRKILASPVNMVTIGTYAELKGSRKRLSQVFYRINALLVRSGFLIAGILSLVAPEIIRLLLGHKWMPMLDAFRMMLIYTMFDPFKLTISSIFIAVGKPKKILQARIVQFAVMVLGLLILSPSLGVAGVAMAVNIMLIVGIAILIWQVREHVDFSIRKLLGVPIVGLLVGMILARLAIDIPGIRGSDWRTGGVKLVMFISLYGFTLLTFERENVRILVNFVNHIYDHFE
jgi:PST family polysaccharide transporter